jgi:hypothetical protein
MVQVGVNGVSGEIVEGTLGSVIDFDVSNSGLRPGVVDLFL